MREEICSKILICGRTGLVPGLLQRLDRELKSGMSKVGVNEYSIVLAEEASEVREECSFFHLFFTFFQDLFL